MLRWNLSAVRTLLLVAALTFGTSPASAGFILNGTFTSGTGGLGSWTTTDSGAVTVSGGVVTITEMTQQSEVDLYQTFTLPGGSKSISFKIVGLSLDPVVTNTLPAAFNASLFNASSTGLLTIDGTTDAFYRRDLTSGPIDEAKSSKVTVTPLGSTTASVGSPILVTLDTSTLASQTVTLQFRLLPDSDFELTNGSISITDVTGDTGTVTPVPEPSGIVLFGMGLAAFAGRRRLRRAS